LKLLEQFECSIYGYGHTCDPFHKTSVTHQISLQRIAIG